MSDMNSVAPSETELANFEDLLTFDFDFERETDGTKRENLVASTGVNVLAPFVPKCEFKTNHYIIALCGMRNFPTSNFCRSKFRYEARKLPAHR